jgi:hypothetical protein
MAFDDTVNLDVDTRVRDSFNTTTTNTANLAADVSNVGNVDSSTNNSGNTDATATDSFHFGSHNTETDTEHSGNDGSYNDTVTITDESMTDNSDNSTNDNSVNAGVRSYDTGFGNVLGAAGGGGDMMIDNRSTILDQSVNTNIAAGGGVSQWVSTDAVVNSGDGAIVAGDDANVEYNIDNSTDLSAGGDILLDGSTKTVDFAYNSNNTSTVDVEVTDNSQDWDLDNVGNEYSATLSVDNSFNDEFTATSTNDWDVDANVIWDSGLSGIADDDSDVDIDL